MLLYAHAYELRRGQRVRSQGPTLGRRGEDPGRGRAGDQQVDSRCESVADRAEQATDEVAAVTKQLG